MLTQYRAAREKGETSLQAAPKTFHDLTGRLPQTTPGYAAHAQHYHQFLGTVSAALGGEASSEEVAHAAGAAFRALQSLPLPPADSQQPPGPPGLKQQQNAPPAPSRETMKHARTLLTTNSGAAFANLNVSDEIIKKLLSSHAPLSAWLRTHRKQSSSSSSATELLHVTMEDLEQARTSRMATETIGTQSSARGAKWRSTSICCVMRRRRRRRQQPHRRRRRRQHSRRHRLH